MTQGNVGSAPHALLLVGHGSRDAEGQREFLEFAARVQRVAGDRPVVPCFLELATPTILEGIARCQELGYQEIAAVPVLLFAARHNKHDVPVEFDHTRTHYPGLQIRYGRHFGITTAIIDGLRDLIRNVEPRAARARTARGRTVVVVVGRGSSDPDANSDVYKLSRLLWEGSGLLSVETCFIGITHPRMSEGLGRCLLLQPERIIVLPYLLFTGVLVKRIAAIAGDFGRAHPEVEVLVTDDIGDLPVFLDLLFEREREALAGTVSMNCDCCKWRAAGLAQDHGPQHGHGSDHGQAQDPYEDLQAYHERIWKPL